MSIEIKPSFISLFFHPVKERGLEKELERWRGGWVFVFLQRIKEEIKNLEIKVVAANCLSICCIATPLTNPLHPFSKTHFSLSKGQAKCCLVATGPLRLLLHI